MKQILFMEWEYHNIWTEEVLIWEHKYDVQSQCGSDYKTQNFT